MFLEPAELVVWQNQFGSQDSHQVCRHQKEFADILTKGNLTRDEWNHLLQLFNISNFSSASCPTTMSKRMQQVTWEERIVAKSKPTLNLGSRSAASSLAAPSSSASSRPGILRAPSQQGSEREFVVDSRASVHMISKKDLNSAELESVTTSRSPTTVIADEWRGHSLCHRIGKILDNASPQGCASSFIARKDFRWTRILIWVNQWSKTTSQ